MSNNPFLRKASGLLIILLLFTFAFLSSCSEKKEDTPPPAKTDVKAEKTGTSGADKEPAPQKKATFRYGEDVKIRNAKRKYLTKEIWDVAGAPSREKEREAFLKAVKKEPNNPEPLYFLGFNYLEGRDWKEAEESFRKVLKLSPDHELAWENLSLVLINREKYNKAKDTAQKALKKFPDNPRLISYLGQSYLKLDKATKAEDVYKDAIDRGVNSPQILWGLAEIYAEEGENTEETKMLLKMSIKDYPDFPNSYLLLAEIYSDEGDSDKAISLLNTVIKKTPSFNEAYRLLGEVYFSIGNYDEAEKYLQKSLTLNYRPDNENEVRIGLAAVYLEKDEDRKAEKLYRGVLQNMGKDPDCLENSCRANLGLALIELKKESSNRSEGYIREAEKADPESDMLNLVKAKALVKAGEYDKAEKLLKTYLDKESFELPLPLYMIYYELARCRASAEDNKGAAEYITKARQKAKGSQKIKLDKLLKKDRLLADVTG